MKRNLKFAAIVYAGLIVLSIVLILAVLLVMDLVSEESKPEATPVLTTTPTATPVPTKQLLPFCTPVPVLSGTKSFQDLLDISNRMPTSTPIPTFTPNLQNPCTTPVPTPTPVPQPLTVSNFRCYEEHGYAFVDGMVRNNLNMRLENVMAVASWYTSEGTFISSHDALIDYNPVMPGQESPFQTIGTHNPQMSKCKLSFKELFGGTIPSDRRK